MSMPYELSWTRFPWEYFQQLILLLVEKTYEGILFDEYLKQGNKQDGIDLISNRLVNGRTITVQCKREKNLSAKELEKIFKEFNCGKHKNDCGRFILATTADLQQKKQQDLITDWKRKMYTDDQIELEIWDHNTINNLLAKSWTYTEKYFGEEAADRHCIKEVFNPDFPVLPAVEDYIPRKLSDLTDDEMHWYVPGKKLLELKELFTAETLDARKICILGSPYFGKTTYIKQTAFHLHKAEKKYYPLFLEVKNLPVQPIEELLTQRFRYWKTLPFRSLILFIDGLDEVRTDRFGEFVRHIKTFSSNFHNLHIVLTCRRLFFEKYAVKSILDNFQFYELFRLEHEDVINYLENALGERFNAFMTIVNKHNLFNSLYHPFYIENLVRQFKESGDLPKTKIEVVQNFIRNTYENTKKRQLGNGENLDDESVLYEQVIKKFALALQVSGLNALTREQIQGLFEPKERELLQHSAMVNANSDGWSFTNAMFQEHFAAFALTSCEFNTIEQISSVGTQLRKIKMKWLQTLASLLSMLNESDTLFKPLLEYFRSDNIELLFMLEPTKFQQDFRLRILEEVLYKIKTQQVRPTVANEHSIGEWMDGIDQAVENLLSNINDGKNTWIVKLFCCEVLSAMHIDQRFHEQIRISVFTQVSRAEDPYYAAKLVKLLITSKAANPDMADRLVGVDNFMEEHEYRQRVYELILVTKTANKHFDYLVKGVSYLLQYNRQITVAGSEYSLEEALISTNHYPHICRLFDMIADREWIEKYRYSSRRGKDFLHRLLIKCADLFPSMPWIIFPVVKYMKMLGNHHLREAHDEFADFFNRTGAEHLAIRIVLSDLLTDKYWQVGAHIRKESFDYLLFEMEEHNAGIKEVNNVMFGLLFRKEPEEYDQFWHLCDAMLEGGLSRAQRENPNDTYQKAEAIKKSNDKIYIQSRENFRKGIENYFAVYGKKSIDPDDLDIEPTEDLRRNKFDSHFLYSYISQCKRGYAKKVTLKTCLKITEDPGWFEHYQIWFILHNNHDSDPVYLQIARSYFDRYINTLDFTNCWWDTPTGCGYLQKQENIGRLLEKYAFDAPAERLLELLWLDHGGLSGWAHENTNHRKSIAEIIVEKLGESNIEKVKEKVLANMRLGIKCREVMGTHIALASRFKITQARDLIWEHILNGKVSHYDIYDLIQVYLELGGDPNKVADYLMGWEDYTSYTYWKLTEQMIDTYPEMIRASLHKALASVTLKEDDKLNAHIYLATLKEIDSFAYLVNELKNKNKAPYTINGKSHVQNVDTAEALKLIEPVAYMVIDPTNDHKRIHDSARGIILEWLYRFAAKSEADMLMVVDFMYSMMEQLKTNFPDHANLYHFYITKVLEDFRASDKPDTSVSRMKAELAKIGW